MADTYVVERATSIDAAPSEVFEHLSDFHQWGDWSPWDELDPDMTKSYTGDAGQVGAGYHWTGNRKVGEGRMTTTSMDPPKQLDIKLEFVKPFKSESETTFLVEPQGDGSNVIWRMTGNHTWMTKIMGIFRSMDSMVGPDFEKGLAKLKTVCEA